MDNARENRWSTYEHYVPLLAQNVVLVWTLKLAVTVIAFSPCFIN